MRNSSGVFFAENESSLKYLLRLGEVCHDLPSEVSSNRGRTSANSTNGSTEISAEPQPVKTQRSSVKASNRNGRSTAIVRKHHRLCRKPGEDPVVEGVSTDVTSVISARSRFRRRAWFPQSHQPVCHRDRCGRPEWMKRQGTEKSRGKRRRPL